MVPTPVVRGTTFGDDRGWITNGDRQDHRVVLLGQQAQLLDVLLGDAQLRGLIAARRLDPLGRLAMPSAVALSTIMMAGGGRTAPR